MLIEHFIEIEIYLCEPYGMMYIYLCDPYGLL